MSCLHKSDMAFYKYLYWYDLSEYIKVTLINMLKKKMRGKWRFQQRKWVYWKESEIPIEQLKLYLKLTHWMGLTEDWTQPRRTDILKHEEKKKYGWSWGDRFKERRQETHEISSEEGFIYH